MLKTACFCPDEFSQTLRRASGSSRRSVLFRHLSVSGQAPQNFGQLRACAQDEHPFGICWLCTYRWWMLNKSSIIKESLRNYWKASMLKCYTKACPCAWTAASSPDVLHSNSLIYKLRLRECVAHCLHVHVLFVGKVCP